MASGQASESVRSTPNPVVCYLRQHFRRSKACSRVKTSVDQPTAQFADSIWTVAILWPSLCWFGRGFEVLRRAGLALRLAPGARSRPARRTRWPAASARWPRPVMVGAAPGTGAPPDGQDCRQSGGRGRPAGWGPRRVGRGRSRSADGSQPVLPPPLATVGGGGQQPTVSVAGDLP